MLEDVTGFAASSVSLVLVLYGLAIAAGNIIGGPPCRPQSGEGAELAVALQAAVLVIFTFTAASRSRP
jgi:MFS transporter, DHA1 family, inner membrane transport protein